MCYVVVSSTTEGAGAPRSLHIILLFKKTPTPQKTIAAGKRAEAMHHLDVLGSIEVGSAWKEGAQEGGKKAEQMLSFHLTRRHQRS